LVNYLSKKERGHKGELTLEPEEAYGPAILSPEKSMDTISLDNFDDDYPIEVGAMFMVSVNKEDSEEMLEIPMTIMDIREDHALVFYGHPLAGQKLRFEIEIEDVRLATDMDRKILQDGLNPPTA
jgi:FKBP-type peptidyl-prolyl cis-trans isomerase SlyD